MPSGYFTAGGSTFYTGSFIKDLNATSLQIVPTVVFGGTGYAVNDTINVTVANASSNFTVTRIAQLKVATVSGGVVTSVTINDAGLYIANSTGSYGSTGNSMTQAATSGAGTGATFTASAPDSSGSCPLRFGMGKVTSVSTNTPSMTTTGACITQGGNEYCYPFAQTSLVTNRIQVSAPAVGDSNGFATGISSPFVPIPYSSQYEYWDIALQCSVMANLYGYADGSAAHTYLTTNYTGPSEVKWKLS
jgi:hypothetical protein